MNKVSMRTPDFLLEYTCKNGHHPMTKNVKENGENCLSSDEAIHSFRIGLRLTWCPIYDPELVSQKGS